MNAPPREEINAGCIETDEGLNDDPDPALATEKEIEEATLVDEAPNLSVEVESGVHLMSFFGNEDNSGWYNRVHINTAEIFME